MTERSRIAPILLAIASILAMPFLWFAQFAAAWIDGAGVFVMLFGASTLVLPVLAFVKGRRAQTTAPQIIGGIVVGIAFAWQVWVVVSQLAPCTLLDGC